MNENTAVGVGAFLQNFKKLNERGVGMKCIDCGKELSKEQQQRNDRIAAKSGTKRLDMCESCWAEYCHHVSTGQ